MAVVNPGKYRHKIQILRNNGEFNDYGEPAGEWEIFKTIWASKEPLLGNEFFTAFTTDSKVSVKFNARYTPGVTNDMRVRHGNEDYVILSAIDVKSLHTELLLYCRKVDDGGTEGDGNEDEI